ncbi:WD repeat and FYVE domain-containing protein 3 [Holothuria leucospilota]|uniref:WD repeat and FYVE domain-containing protein 3 n=1 Tax=Holothuria leucospilota TaxID=206669 RepID=A0A9Q0YJD1_HOLLE|nr:WD repeat and FYVE domain-containing protein 3 [Holothuria leucospilota]
MQPLKKFMMNRPSRGPTHSQDNELGLMHLRKLYVELCCTAQPLSQQEQEDKMYMMLPLFCKVFEGSPASEMIGRFGDVLQFATQVSRLFVTEIRRRATDKPSTKDAACAIIKYLEVQESEENSKGWMLLSTLNLLASGGQSIVQPMTIAALPSTLVKCLYLFFDLPEIEGPSKEIVEEMMSKQNELHRVIIQLLKRLCQYPASAEELAKEDDLNLLFSAISSWCPTHNIQWRKGATEVLTTISRHGLTEDVVQYIHRKGCLSACIWNMNHRVQGLKIMEIVEMCFTVYSLLKDSSDKTPILMDDFRTSEGYVFLTEFALKLEEMTTEESKHSMRHLMFLMASLTTCGFRELRPNSAVLEAPFQQPGFTFPVPCGKGQSVRNLQAFQVLQTVFLKAKTEQLCKIILEVINNIYNSDNANYFVLEPLHTISQFIDQMSEKTPAVQRMILELLEFVVERLNFVPYKELISLSLLLKAGRFSFRDHFRLDPRSTVVLLTHPSDFQSLEEFHASIECNILAVQCLLNILKWSALYRDVFREVGLLEVMVTCLNQYAAMLKSKQSESGGERVTGVEAEIYVPERQQNLAFGVMDILTELLKENEENARIFRECGGARCAHNLVPYFQCRHHALEIVQQLIYSKDGGDDMETLVIIMQSAEFQDLQLKVDIIQALHNVLLSNHRSRSVFREAQGFVSVLSVLIGMEGALCDPESDQWKHVTRDQIFQLLESVNQLLAVSMRQEPANTKFFSSEIKYENITRAYRFLGCFADVCVMPKTLPVEFESGSDDLSGPDTLPFFNNFEIEEEYGQIPNQLKFCCVLLRLLYKLSVDHYKESNSSSNASSPLPSPSGTLGTSRSHPSLSSARHTLSSPQHPSNSRHSLASPRGSVILGSPISNKSLILNDIPMIVQSGAILTLIDLLPGIPVCKDFEKESLCLKLHVLQVIHELLISERNQQVLCEAGLPQRILEIGSMPLANEEHPLHATMQHMLEKLASQAFEPKELRDFLRLSSPLNCKSISHHDTTETEYKLIPDDSAADNSNLHLALPTTNFDNIEVLEQSNIPKETLSGKKSNSVPSLNDLGEGSTVPLTRVKCLVSMTTPRDTRLTDATSLPAFVEFDMNVEGYGCLYLPSIAPQSTASQAVVAVGMTTGSSGETHGGIGSGDRAFPPQSGVSYSVWFCVDQFGSMSEHRDHAVRLLTIVRTTSSSGPEQTCFSLMLSSKERKLILSTGEEALGRTVSKKKSNHKSENSSTFKFFCQDLGQEGRWHHLAVIFNKTVIKNNTTAALFVDGVQLHSHKISYINSSPNSSGSNPSSNHHAISIHAYIGTPPALYAPSQLKWRLGPTHLIEDALSQSTIVTIYQLGPSYVGSFLAPKQDDVSSPEQIDVSSVQIQEEKIVFGLHSNAQSVLTVHRIKKIFNKVDSRAVAKLLNLSSHDNTTPIRLIHNSVAHLAGPARSFGAVLIGGNGVRTFSPKPVSSTLCNVGGCGVLLGLIAMANDIGGLYAAVKALVCVTKNNVPMIDEMQRRHGFQILAYLFRKKKHLLNSHILHLTYSLVGTIDSDRESTLIPHSIAFEDLLCDLEVWQNTPYDLQKSLCEHFLELVTDSVEAEKNQRLMLQLEMVKRLLHVVRGSALNQSTIAAIANLLQVLLQSDSRPRDILSFGQFLAATLPLWTVSEAKFTVEEIAMAAADGETPGKPPESQNIWENFTENICPYHIYIRNTFLELLLKLMMKKGTQTLNISFSEEIQRILGFDWFLLFLQGHLHSSTVILALRILVTMFVANPACVSKFRDGTIGGGWLENTEPVLHNRMGVVLGFNVGKGSKHSQNREIIVEASHLPGFTILQWLLRQHTDIPEIYLMLMALSLGQSVDDLPDSCTLDLDSIWKFIFKASTQHSAPVSIDMKINVLGDAVITILALIREILNQAYEDPPPAWSQDYPITLIQFLMYLYHNVKVFKPVCMSTNFLTALASTLFPYVPISEQLGEESNEPMSPADDARMVLGLDIPIMGAKIQPRNTPANLTTHSAKRNVMDLIRIIVVDSLSLPMPNRGASCVLDILLEACPERASPGQLNEFQTELLTLVMSRILGGDALLGKDCALPISDGGSYNHLVQSVFYFCSRLVDKLWQGVFNKKPKDVFEFISLLIAQSKKKSHGMSLDDIYHCLNRTVLYQLSRPSCSVADQMTLLATLRNITENRTLLFGAGNYEQEFVSCLCHCLFCLTDDITSIGPCLNCQTIDVNRTTTWHVDSTMGAEKCEHTSNTSAPQGQLMVRNAARRVWDDLISSKKHQIEELFKVTLPNASAGQRNVVKVDLKIAKAALGENAARSWQVYITGEKKNSARDQAKQRQSVLASKVTSGFNLLSSRKSKRESASIRASVSSLNDVNIWTFTHVFIVRDLVELQFNQYRQSQRYLHRFISGQWEQMEYELLRERGIWGPEQGCTLDKWMLDMTEGPSRMRKKMMKNDMFYSTYLYMEENNQEGNKSNKGRPATSFDSKIYARYSRTKSLLNTQKTDIVSPEPVDEQQVDGVYPQPEEDPETGLDGQNNMDNEEDDDLETPENETQVDRPNEPKTDHQMVLRLLEEGEKIRHIFRCTRIQGLDTIDGLLLFCKDHFYVVDGFTLLSSREICDIDSVPAQHQDPIIPRTTRGTASSGLKRTSSKYAYEDIREVLKRRYLLQPIAIEVFSADGRNCLLAFPRKVHNKVYRRFMAEASRLTDSASESVTGHKRNMQVEGGANFLVNLIGEKSVTQRWERREISNFQYLMALNTLAGRSYNDLMQYPVFPWILADYDSEELDLTNPNAFRDLSKPMGAQTEKRLQQFCKRYTEWEDPEQPPYYYGTHYSSAMIVASYLIRMEPFTHHFLRLQGGNFDLADRMFHSIKDAWLSASEQNMSDIKELIPEFFYLPEFLLNHNNFDLGIKQSGVALGDCVLPPWAKGDPKEFIRMHREALECDYVSAHLHEWIDLIFGYKQQGKEAERSHNVFHHLFYEGYVDIYNIKDPLKKSATIGFINNFGQTPTQLFKRPHPQRRLSNRTGDSTGNVIPIAKLFFHNLDTLKPSLNPIKELKGGVGQIHPLERSTVVAVEKNKVLFPPSYQRYLAFGYADSSLRIGSCDTERAVTVFEGNTYGEILCAVCPNSRTIITGGTSTVVHVWQLEYGRERSKQLTLKQCMYGHTKAVGCLAVSTTYNFIVSGSKDQTCIVWDLNQLVFIRQLKDLKDAVTAIAINDLTGDIATCAGVYLHLWSINGDKLASVNTSTGRDQQILCCAMSELVEWDLQNVIMTGSTDGVVRMWSVEYVQVPDEEQSALRKSPSASNNTSSQPSPLLGRVDQSQYKSNQSEDTPSEEDSTSLGSSGMLTPKREQPERSFSESVSEDLKKSKDSLDDPSYTASRSRTETGDSLEGLEIPSSQEGKITPPTSLPINSGVSVSGMEVPGPRDEVSEDGSFDERRSSVKSDSALHSCLDQEERQRRDVSSSINAHSVSQPDLAQSQQSPVHRNSNGGSNTSESTTEFSPEGAGMRSSKSSIKSEEYIIISEQDLKAYDEDQKVQEKRSAAHRNKLKPGFKWQRQLVFRSKLTMHTAFERKDNPNPAAVTALAISKDHMRIFVGDERGRVFSWSVSDQPGKGMVDHWIRDESGDNCTACKTKFTMTERRHHCRNCGKLFCAKCSRFEAEIPRYRANKAIRVCQSCFITLNSAPSSV